MKYLIFGTGDCYTRYKIWFDKSDIVALMDNSAQKQNTDIDGIRVMAPADAVKLSFDCVVIMSFYVKEMKRQLRELGVSNERIYHFYDLHKLVPIDASIRKPDYFGDALEVLECKEAKKILLLFRDLTLGGPAIALFYAIRILKNQGWRIIVASMFDGPLKEKILEEGTPVIVDERLQIGTMKEVEWINDFSVLLCNTNNYYIFLSDRDNRIPVIWWLHDSLFFYDGMDKELLMGIDQTNLYVVSVGSIPQKAIQTYIPSLPVGQLLYGVEDVSPAKTANIQKDEVIVFVTIGYIEARKGQDILIQAIKKLPDKVRQKAVFYLVGQNSSLMAREIWEQIQEMPEVIMTGTIGREDINAILEKADMMICPSREDPMPTVAAEAMMHSIPCLLSDVVGTAEYVRSGEDGMIFPMGDVDALCREIQWSIEHRDLIVLMGEKARRVYEKVFSMEVFETTLLKIVEDINKNS